MSGGEGGSTTLTTGEVSRVATRAFGWSFLNTVVARFGTLAIGIALARLLGPTAFGTFAVATVALLAILSFNDLGVSLAIVRWRGDPAAIAPTVNTISIGSSLILFGLVMLGAPTFSAAMGDPGATPVVRVMAIAIVVNSVVAVPAALLQREFQQKRRMAADQVNIWLGAAISLALALTGFGAMSLAIGRIAGSLVSGVMFLIWSPLPYRLGFDARTAAQLLRFGLPLAGSSMVLFAASYADQLTTGAVLGATALGFYVLAFNLSSWPVAIFSQPLRQISPAAFSRLQDDIASKHAAFLSTARILAAVTVPACLVLAGSASQLVHFIYGDVWRPASAALLFLALSAAARIFFELAYDYLVVEGRTGRLMIIQIVWLVLLVPAVIGGAHLDGIRGVAWAQFSVAVIFIAPAYVFLLRRAGIGAKPIMRLLWRPSVVGLVAGAACWAIGNTLPQQPFLACLATGGVGLLSLLVIYAVDGSIRGLVRQVRERRAA